MVKMKNLELKKDKIFNDILTYFEGEGFVLNPEDKILIKNLISDLYQGLYCEEYWEDFLEKKYEVDRDIFEFFDLEIKKIGKYYFVKML